MLEKLLEYIDSMYKQTIYNNLVKIFDGEIIVSFYIRFDNDKYLSQVTFWDDLSCMKEIFLIEENRYLIHERNELYNFDDLTYELNSFMDEINKL